MEKKYYQFVFPAGVVHALFENHNRAFGIESLDAKVFARYREASTPKELRALVTDRCGVGKLNIGPIYDGPPSKHAALTLVPVEAELKIDLDLDDYAIVSKSDIGVSDRHWPVVCVGLEVVRRVLQDVFAFEHILGVYSGRRGAHLWVFDRRAKLLDDAERGAIISFLQPFEQTSRGQTKKPATGHQTFEKNDTLDWIQFSRHPTYRQLAKEVLMPFMNECGAIASRDGGLGLFDLRGLRMAFVKLMQLERCATAEQIARDAQNGPKFWRKIVRCCGEDSIHLYAAVWRLIGPRLDTNVSRQRSHMLKSPFSIHPKTRRISLPIAAGALSTFCPAKCLTIDTVDIANLAPYVQLVDEFVTRLRASNAVAEERVLSSPATSVTVPVISFVGGGALQEAPLLAPFERDCIILKRMFAVEACNGRLRIDVKSIVHDRQKLKPNGFPPIPEGRSINALVEEMEETVRHASEHAGRWHAGVSYSILFVGDTVNQCRVERLLALLAERPTLLATVRMEWGGDAIRSALRMLVSQFVEDIRVIRI
jgi:DNA primase small subunit